MINTVNLNSNCSPSCKTNEKQNHLEKDKKITKEDNGVIIDIGKSEVKSATYSKPASKTPDAEEIKRLWDQTEKATESLRSLVEKLINRQGKKTTDIPNSKEVVNIDGEARAEAERMISEDGEWGVKAVSTRIVDFAKAISGGDKSRLGELRDAIKEGFRQAEKAFGGALPAISRETYDEVMKQLDNWEKEE